MPSMNITHHRDVEELLWARTQAVAAPDIDFSSLSTLSLDTWESKDKPSKNESFRTFTRQLVTPNIPTVTEVLVTGELQCSVTEAAALLCSTGESEFNSVMTRMYGRSFQRGTVVHSFKTDNQSGQLDGDFLPPYRCVKTARFARPRLALFNTDEKWCFLEEFLPVVKDSAGVQDGFTLSQRSLRPSTLPRAVRPPIELVRRSHGVGFTRSKKHTHQLLGLSLGYSIQTISGRHPAAVRVVFYGYSSDDENEDFNVVRRRIKLLARGVLKLPDMVRRRRISAQLPADAWSISRLASKYPASPAASHCVNCARKFHKLLMIKKTRCYLCAHFVCSRCWLRQPLETANGRKIAVLVCPHCLGSIQNCNYAHLAASYVSGRGSGSSASTSSRVSMFPAGGAGEQVLRPAQVLSDADDAPEPGHAVVSYLADVLSDEAEEESSSKSGSTVDLSTKVSTATNVLQQLTSVLDEGVNRVMAHCFYDSDNNTEEPETEMSSALQRLQAQFSREVLPLEACILSNAVARTYPIDTTGGESVAAVPVGPVPPNETHRLEAITQEQLLLAMGSPELTLVCELASQEMSCMASLVTIVGRTLQYVLATDYPSLQNAELPREHTLCQHLLMGDRPMLVQHPEADVRFCNLSLVVDYGIQFYAGFPIFSRDGLAVVGSLCCLDIRPREMTQSQYSTLLHLTRTASSIIVAKCVQRRGLQKLRKRE
ncbi:GAF domain-containing protein [Phytophthora cinnamomi]|uniref:GAF domain-containing protein n=1 Tax=Phytophthora cinnamomi TaxID=4785 RepID=UPI003559A285|nr:GAF domain-containing protein [Phytophthora cinnamomi]